MRKMLHLPYRRPGLPMLLVIFAMIALVAAFFAMYGHTFTAAIGAAQVTLNGQAALIVSTWMGTQPLAVHVDIYTCAHDPQNVNNCLVGAELLNGTNNSAAGMYIYSLATAPDNNYLAWNHNACTTVTGQLQFNQGAGLQSFIVNGSQAPSSAYSLLSIPFGGNAYNGYQPTGYYPGIFGANCDLSRYANYLPLEDVNYAGPWNATEQQIYSNIGAYGPNEVDVYVVVNQTGYAGSGMVQLSRGPGSKFYIESGSLEVYPTGTPTPPPPVPWWQSLLSTVVGAIQSMLSHL